jgi:transposase
MWTDQQRKAHKPRDGRYPSDLSDEEWAIIEPMIPPARTGGRKRETDVREVTGCQWRQLPKDFPPHTTVYKYFWDGRATVSSIGFIKLCCKHAEMPVGARETPQRQSSTRRLRRRPKRGVSIDPIGYDAGKKIKGIKGNALVDTEGHLLSLEIIRSHRNDCRRLR